MYKPWCSTSSEVQRLSTYCNHNSYWYVDSEWPADCFLGSERRWRPNFVFHKLHERRRTATTVQHLSRWWWVQHLSTYCKYSSYWSVDSAWSADSASLTVKVDKGLSFVFHKLLEHDLSVSSSCCAPWRCTGDTQPFLFGHILVCIFFSFLLFFFSFPFIIRAKRVSNCYM